MLYFDIGANVGRWSLENINNCEKIIAVEASSEIYQKLIKRCDDKNIICLNYAVCNRPDYEEIQFYENNCISTINKDWLCSEQSRFFNRPYKETTAKTIRLDTLIEQYGKPDLIKIDVEGAEYLVISSLTQKINTICFEWTQEFSSIAKDCIKYLSSIGFTKFYVHPNGLPSFHPSEEEYTEDLEKIEEKLKEERITIREIDNMKISAWGMIWAK